MASLSSEKVIVKCSKGEVLEVDKALVKTSQTLKRLIEEKGNETENVITLPDISREILSMINNYVKKQANANSKLAAGKASKAREESLYAWDAKFMMVGRDTLYNLIVVSFISCNSSYVLFSSLFS
ncbi:S-phase kinase-associated protein 1-like [Sesbania bispinosa]|nr:S-phase kinase-associated protein 1-like [Sesbania bispinosa]